ncbi:Ankyrin repeat domain-containing protein 13A [Hypsibius exemplaris]|uniref:Ankyrin repeat domain-containing protein 13A n=1 Tax=Hypsibius exemplaris TaxID=2072580 RepID=A0A9X6RJJ5_HYPEX|nr:Ankyrin repeat domain-containing protein 13A [Hypsibius exemplaris]
MGDDHGEGDETALLAGGNPVDILQRYPLHLAVWKNEISLLRRLCINLQNKDLMEERDPHGRTPLLLAVCLDYFECAQVLLENGAVCGNSVRSPDGWSAVHEATCTGDVELLSLILQYRDFQRLALIRDLDTDLLGKLREVPDFYVEMRWEFASWIPFVARLCPYDICKIYKKGANVRLDTTLVGFENNSWTRGKRSLMFVERNGEMAFHEIDHDARIVRTEKSAAPPSDVSDDAFMQLQSAIPTDAVLQQRMRTPVMLTSLDSASIKFERARSGFLWRSDKVEEVSGHACKVFAASNVTFVTRSRTEHLTDNDKKALREELAKNPLNGLFSSASKGPVDGTEPSLATEPDVPLVSEEQRIFNPTTVTCEEYFDESVELGDRDIGRPKHLSKRQKSFKANLWLCDEYPLSLREQVLPVIDMMASTNAHFAKLKDFITLHLPSGFPVKIEIPLFHVLTAKITFENIYGSLTPVESVTYTAPAEDGDLPGSCKIDDSVFQIPDDYERGEAWWRDDLAAMEEEEVADDIAATLHSELNDGAP